MNRSIVVRLEAPSEVVGKSLLWESMVRYKYRVIGLVLLGAVLGVVAGFIMTRKYQATAVATYAQQNSLSSTLQNLTSQFSGLSALAGISQGGSDNDSSARTMLESRLVAGQLIERFSLMPLLFPDSWDSAARKWKGPESKHPTVERGIDRFLDSVLSVDYDNADSKVSVSIVWPDRTMAATLANAVIDDVNNTMRAQALRDAEKCISFLNRELAKNATVELQEAINALIKQQLETSMYASVREGYALRVLDPAMPPDARKIYWPKKSALGLVGAFLGLIFAAIGSLVAGRLSGRRA
jgi:uncharacterized protein involved in exopolysaccharide biosynthesis